MNSVKSVVYVRETDLDPAEFRCVLLESGLARPTDDLPRLGEMLRGADLVVTARFDRADRKLIGIARCITDFSWCCYLSELAVSKEAQGLGVGKGLIDETRRQLGPRVSLILASMPDAVGFYDRIGMPRMPDAYYFKRER
ncbi:GNAT family N-acetyltransferase [Reyranella sp.]|uniref:GNAT family N-acetyltransferase n=1 Tax=Reyranella sp. TaxID=1929291 RepID=UPI001208966A|nr:GNAT family N-acetyltransferase [Reyranella sp.]TAJ83701.1 MAG: GNAT family N-acetyltransferase [Reyranella sp.]